MTPSRVLFSLLVLGVVAERLLELSVSRRHERKLRQRGAIEVGARHYPIMVSLHSLWLVAALAEVWWLDRTFDIGLGVLMLLTVAATQGMRYWVIATLGDRWTTRVWVLPGEPLVASGPFRWVRHPNYIAVALEIVALPLVHGAWITALFFGLANLALLWVRIRVEEAALAR